MRSFFEWFRELADSTRPWLILGKGPSFAGRGRYDLGDYHLLSLNHAVREQPVLAAHIIDLDVVRACEDVLERHARVVVMPWYPHVRNQVGAQSLDELVRAEPLLGRLAQQGRLLWYDLSTSPTRHGPGPVVQATYFSAEAALSLLALAGARRIRTLGVDGGAAYSADFDDLRDSTLLNNGYTNFDLQFQGFARTILETGVDFAPLNLPSPARVYVAHAPAEAVAVAVLAHSIRRHASLSVEVVAVPASAAGALADDGGAIVVSPRVQCFADFRLLWAATVAAGEVTVPAPGGGDDAAMPTWLVLAGAGIGSRLGELASAVRQGASPAALAARTGLPVRAGLSPRWRPARRYAAGRTPLVCFAEDGTEPWLSRVHPLGHLWVRDLINGVRRGHIPLTLIAEEVRRGHVRPSLMYQVEHGLEEAPLLPRRVRALDRGFRDPSGRRVPVIRPMAVLQALARQAYQQARAYRAEWRARGLAGRASAAPADVAQTAPAHAAGRQ